MNSKIILGIVVLVFIVGVGYFTTTQSKNAQTVQVPIDMQSTPKQMESSPSAEPSNTIMEKTETTNVSLTMSGFTPETITVKTGTKVLWTNKSGDAATVDSAFHPTHRVYPPLNLGEFADGKTVSLVFDTPGTYKYHDHLNPSRTGTVRVE